MLKGKRAVGRRLREGSSHLSSKIFHDITETMWHIFWYYTVIFIVKIAPFFFSYRECICNAQRPSLQITVQYQKICHIVSVISWKSWFERWLYYLPLISYQQLFFLLTWNRGWMKMAIYQHSPARDFFVNKWKNMKEISSFSLKMDR